MHAEQHNVHLKHFTVQRALQCTIGSTLKGGIVKIKNTGNDFELGWRKKKIESTTPKKLPSLEPGDKITITIFGFLNLIRLIVREEVGLVELGPSINDILEEWKEAEVIPDLLCNLKRYFQERD